MNRVFSIGDAYRGRLLRGKAQKNRTAKKGVIAHVMARHERYLDVYVRIFREMGQLILTYQYGRTMCLASCCPMR